MDVGSIIVALFCWSVLMILVGCAAQQRESRIRAERRAYELRRASENADLRNAADIRLIQRLTRCQKYAENTAINLGRRKAVQG